jgi:hypothetical protein
LLDQTPKVFIGCDGSSLRREIMKQAKLIVTILITILICCSSSTGQSSTGIGVKPSIYPIGQVSSSGIVSLGDMKVNTINISQLKFICDVMASCGLYPAGPGDIKSGAGVYPAGQDDIKTGAGIYPIGQISNGEMVDLGGVRSGVAFSLIDFSRIKVV